MRRRSRCKFPLSGQVMYAAVHLGVLDGTHASGVFPQCLDQNTQP